MASLFPMESLLLAQQGGIVSYLAWVGAFIVVVVLAGVALLVYRRRVLADEHESERQRGLLDDLRAMRDRGAISQDEYDAARRSIASRLAGRAPVVPRSPGPAGRAAAPGVDLTGDPLPKDGTNPASGRPEG